MLDIGNVHIGHFYLGITPGKSKIQLKIWRYKMLNKLLMVTICLSPFYIHAKDNSKNSVTIKNATEVIKNRMKDPESTQYRMMWIYDFRPRL